MRFNAVALAVACCSVASAYTNASLPSSQNSTLFQPLFPKHSNSTPRYQNLTGLTVNPLVKVLHNLDANTQVHKRQLGDNGLPVGMCAPGTPCSNGACCGSTGICGYSPDECGTKVCLSNCDAKAECGQYAAAGKQNCPLNVCCSHFGFCGTTDDFCNTNSANPCQKGYGSCGSANTPSCSGNSASSRTIGYYEGWSSTRQCDARDPEDLDLTGITHLNFAFAFFDPGTFEVVPMNSGDPSLYTRFTALKNANPSLKTWISVGGWSFNDPGNTPDTRAAFGNAAGSASNRAKFISALTKFMTTYNFDGVDIDWEYPGADDRGGVTADTQNFVALLKDMRATWGDNYGISVTLPSSYWYMRWFDLKGMQTYLDWFNFMSYDVHGVWDSTNKNTGPYVRPHTNMTEIEDGLSLLWRAGVEPSKVTLGLGWYGRSFTLKDPGCNKPGCVFTEGGLPGECTNSAGTLSNAEINRLIAKHGLEPTFDQDAMVNWITWDSNQWVSYDNGPSMQMKIQRANQLCLGGTMIWSLDQDDTEHTSNADLQGIGTSSGAPEGFAKKYKEAHSVAQHAADTANSCYWSFCGGDCVSGYFEATQARGQIGGVASNTVCKGDDYQRLCCAPGTSMGTCSWDGWSGVGMACNNTCNDPAAIAVAGNSNHIDYVPEGNINNDQTCNGGSQLYCCVGFKPSSRTNTDNLNLIGRTSKEKRDDSVWLSERGTSPAQNTACAAIAPAIIAISILTEALTLGISTLVGAGAMAVCLEASTLSNMVGAVGIATLGVGTRSGAKLGLFPQNGKPKHKPKPKYHKPVGQPKGSRTHYGQWPIAVYGPQDMDCSVTYTCRYGRGFDEVCDNQRYAIQEALGGNVLYHYRTSGRQEGPQKKNYPKERNAFYLKEARQSINNVARCQVDEFPMGSLQEGTAGQVVRLVNGPANGKQGTDFGSFLSARWEPCRALRSARGRPDPPITWAFDGMLPNDARVTGRSDGNHFIQRYGFDSQTPGNECWATYVVPGGMSNQANLPAAGSHVTVSDHGFRGFIDDPMFVNYNWPLQDYKTFTSRARGLGGVARSGARRTLKCEQRQLHEASGGRVST